MKNANKDIEKSVKSAKIPLNTQLFAKSSKDFETIILPKVEYAHVMQEIATNLTEEQSKRKVFSKNVGG